VKPSQNISRLPAPTTYARGAITARSKVEVLDRLRREQIAGRVAAAGQVVLITQGQRAGEYAIPVQLIIQPGAEQPRPRRLKIFLAVVGALTVLFSSLAWLLSSLSGPSLAAFLVTLLIAFCVWVGARHGRRGNGRTTSVTVNVDIR
jgi:hypothetical protein